MKTNHPTSSDEAAKGARRSSRQPALGGRATRAPSNRRKKPTVPAAELPRYNAGLH